MAPSISRGDAFISTSRERTGWFERLPPPDEDLAAIWLFPRGLRPGHGGHSGPRRCSLDPLRTVFNGSFEDNLPQATAFGYVRHNVRTAQFLCRRFSRHLVVRDRPFPNLTAASAYADMRQR